MTAHKQEIHFQGRERILSSGLVVVSGLAVPDLLRPRHQDKLANQVFAGLEAQRGLMRQISREQLRQNIAAGDFAVSMAREDDEPIFLAVAQSWPLTTRDMIREVGTVMRLNVDDPRGRGQAAEVVREATLLASMRPGMQNVEALTAETNAGAQRLFRRDLKASDTGVRPSDYVFVHVDGEPTNERVIMTVFDLNNLAGQVKKELEQAA